MEQGTIPQLFVAKARQYGSARVALREKAYGIWQEVSWQQYYEHVCALCLGLIQLGLQRGDKVAVICGNRPEWLYVELAAQSAGAVPVGIFVDSLPHQVKFILDHAEARFVFVEDQERVDKVLDVRDELPGLERVIVDDTRGLEDYREPLLLSLGEVEAFGRDLRAREPHLYDELLAKGAPSDVALLAYTSGTTGMPKAAMISHRNLLSMAAGVMHIDPISDANDMVSLGWGTTHECRYRIVCRGDGQLSRKARDDTRRYARDRSTADPRSAAALGDDVLGVPGEDRCCGVPQALGRSNGPGHRTAGSGTAVEWSARWVKLATACCIGVCAHLSQPTG